CLLVRRHASGRILRPGPKTAFSVLLRKRKHEWGTGLFAAADIARLVDVSIPTVRRWIADEVLPSTKVGGARVVARVDLERLLCSPSDPIEESDDVTGEGD